MKQQELLTAIATVTKALEAITLAGAVPAKRETVGVLMSLIKQVNTTKSVEVENSLEGEIFISLGRIDSECFI